MFISLHNTEFPVGKSVNMMCPSLGNIFSVENGKVISWHFFLSQNAWTSIHCGIFCLNGRADKFSKYNKSVFYAVCSMFLAFLYSISVVYPTAFHKCPLNPEHNRRPKKADIKTNAKGNSPKKTIYNN